MHTTTGHKLTYVDIIEHALTQTTNTLPSNICQPYMVANTDIVGMRVVLLAAGGLLRAGCRCLIVMVRPIACVAMPRAFRPRALCIGRLCASKHCQRGPRIGHRSEQAQRPPSEPRRGRLRCLWRWSQRLLLCSIYRWLESVESTCGFVQQAPQLAHTFHGRCGRVCWWWRPGRRS